MNDQSSRVDACMIITMMNMHFASSHFMWIIEITRRFDNHVISTKSHACMHAMYASSQFMWIIARRIGIHMHA